MMLAIVILILSSSTQATSFAPIEIYNRCYIRMTRTVPKPDSILYRAVLSGTKSPTQACLELFDQAQMGSNGILVQRMNSEAQAIVKTFHDLHISWFQSKTYSPGSSASFLVRDVEEPALFFTRATFMKDQPFRSVVTLNTGLQGVRDQNVYPNELSDFMAQTILRYPATSAYASAQDVVLAYAPGEYDSEARRFRSGDPLRYNLPLAAMVESGRLVGIKSASSDLQFPKFRLLPNVSAELNEAVATIYAPFSFNRHFGGGVIGSQNFLLANANLLQSDIPDGLDIINRRIGGRIFQDLLCHTLPTLAIADVRAEIKPLSEYTFQRQGTCMQCHSSIDGVSTTLRNLVYYQSAPPSADATVGKQITGIASLPVRANSSVWALQEPTGRLHYRENLTNAVVDTPVSSISAVGEQLANQNDLYLCAASRYYSFFTGINVDLSAPSSRPIDRYHQDIVRRIGDVLKETQSVRSALEQIFMSRAFHKRNSLAESVQ